jgi:hypothetical protein
VHPTEARDPQQADHGDLPAVFLVDHVPPAGVLRGIVGRAQHVGGAGQVLDHVLLVVGALARGDRVDAELVQVDGVVLPDAEPARGAFAIGDDEVDGALLADLRQQLFYAPDAGLADDLAEEEDSKRHQAGTSGTGSVILKGYRRIAFLTSSGAFCYLCPCARMVEFGRHARFRV